MTDNIDDFEQWYQAIHPRLCTSLALAFGNTELAQDSADEAITRALERWDRVSAMESTSAWVYKVAFNDARRRLRRTAIEKRLLQTRRAEQVRPPAGELWLIVGELPERQRQAVVLRHVGQLQENEIGSVMNISRGGVSSTLRAAYESLRTTLNHSNIMQEAL